MGGGGYFFFATVIMKVANAIRNIPNSNRLEYVTIRIAPLREVRGREVALRNEIANEGITAYRYGSAENLRFPADILSQILTLCKDHCTPWPSPFGEGFFASLRGAEGRREGDRQVRRQVRRRVHREEARRDRPPSFPCQTASRRGVSAAGRDTGRPDR